LLLFHYVSVKNLSFKYKLYILNFIKYGYKLKVSNGAFCSLFIPNCTGIILLVSWFRQLHISEFETLSKSDNFPIMVWSSLSEQVHTAVMYLTWFKKSVVWILDGD
jgi:hypothetical protein